MAANPPAGVAAAARALGGRRESFTTLPEIDCPTLLVAGDADAITPESGMRELQAKIPGSQIVVVRGAGHLTPVEQTGPFVDALRGFLRGLPTAE